MEQRRPALIVLDDWEGRWRDSPLARPLEGRYDVTIVQQPLAAAELERTLAPFSHLVLNRERTRLDEPLIARLPRLRVVANTGTGVPHIDRAALASRGIRLITTTGGSTAGVVEQTFALLLGVVKRVPELDAAMRTHASGWNRPIVGDLAGKRFGVAGMGTIGAAAGGVARAFGMHVAGWGRSFDAKRAGELGIAHAGSLVELAGRVDVLSLHVRLSPETRRIVDARVLAALPDGAILINTARAELVDEAALLRETQSGRLRAGLDVFVTEPPLPDDPLRDVPGALSPHLGWMTEATWDAFIASVVAQLQALPDEPDNPVAR